jgi:hypothetical protein
VEAYRASLGHAYYGLRDAWVSLPASWVEGPFATAGTGPSEGMPCSYSCLWGTVAEGSCGEGRRMAEEPLKLVPEELEVLTVEVIEVVLQKME